MYSRNAWLSEVGTPERPCILSACIFSPFYSLLYHCRRQCTFSKDQPDDRLCSSSNGAKTHNRKHLPSECEVKVFQKPHCLKRESMRTSSKIASVLFIAADSAAGKSSRLQPRQSAHPVSCHSELLFVRWKGLALYTEKYLTWLPAAPGRGAVRITAFSANI